MSELQIIPEEAEKKYLQGQAETYYRLSRIAKQILSYTYTNPDISDPQLIAKLMENMKTNFKMPGNKDGQLSDDVIRGECERALQIFKDYKQSTQSNPFPSPQTEPDMTWDPRWSAVLQDLPDRFEFYSQHPDSIVQLMKDTNSRSFIEGFIKSQGIIREEKDRPSDRPAAELSKIEQLEAKDYGSDLAHDDEENFTPFEDLHADARELKESADRFFNAVSSEDDYYRRMFVDSFQRVSQPENPSNS